jgi:hypothetical protein
LTVGIGIVQKEPQTEFGAPAASSAAPNFDRAVVSSGNDQRPMALR